MEYIKTSKKLNYRGDEMPPSGYTTDQKDYIVNFLKSCAKSLELEGRQKGLNIIEALSNECRNIEWILKEEKVSSIQENILNLTRSFYKLILAENPQNYSEFEVLIEKVEESISDSVLRIHVPEIA